MKKRIKYFDIAKGIAIICVILGHLGIDNINRVVFTFHMPLFFLISGYFLSEKGNIKIFIKGKINQLLTPYVFTSILITVGSVFVNIIFRHNEASNSTIIMNWIKASIYGAGSTANKIPFNIGQIGAIWFLLALLVALVEVYCLKKNQYGWLIVIVLAYIATVSQKYIWLPFSIQAGVFCAIFVWMGYWVKKKQLLEKEIPVWGEGIALGIWGFAMVFCGGFYLVSAKFEHGIFDFFVACAGTYFVIRISKLIEYHTEKIAHIFEFYGRNSLIILCMHLVELNVFPWDLLWSCLMERYKMSFYAVLYIVIFLKLAWCTITVLAIERIPWLFKIFNGGYLIIKDEKCLKKEKNVELNKYVIAGIGISCFVIVNDMTNSYITEIIACTVLPAVIIMLGSEIYKWNKLCYKNAVKKFGIPYILCGIVGIAIDFCFHKGSLGKDMLALATGMNAASKRFNSLGTVSVIWILVCFLFASMFYVLGIKSSDKTQVAESIVMVIVGAGVGKYYAFLPWCVDIALILAGVMISGCVIERYKKNLRKKEIIFFISLMIVWLYLFYSGCRFNMVLREYTSIPFGFIMLIAGGVLSIKFLETILSISTNLFNMFEGIGRLSYYILGCYMVDYQLKLGENCFRKLLPVEYSDGKMCVIRMVLLCIVGMGATMLIRRKNNEKD